MNESKLDKILEEITHLKVQGAGSRKDIQFLKDTMQRIEGVIPECEKKEISQRIKTNRWLIGLIFSSLLGMFLFTIRTVF